MKKGNKQRAVLFKRKRLKTKILTACLCAACICGVAFATPSLALINNSLNEVFVGLVKIKQTAELIYNDETKDQLKNNPSGNYTLGENITVKYDDLRSGGGFSGSLNGAKSDGSNYTITIKDDSLYNKDTSKGLFGEISGKISNVNIAFDGELSNPSSVVALLGSTLKEGGELNGITSSVNINAYNGKYAGLVKDVYGTIVGCTNTGNITYAKGSASGIADKVMPSGKIINSINTGNINTNDYSSGIANTVEGLIENSYNTAAWIKGQYGAAGIAYNVTGTIRNSHNQGKIESTNGGAAGIAYTVTNGRIEYSTNSVTGYVDGYGQRIVGGIAGEMTGVIESCFNYGTVIKRGWNPLAVGGIAGSMKGYIYNSNNTGTVTNGNTGSSALAGGIAGIMEGQIISNKLDSQGNPITITVTGTIKGAATNGVTGIVGQLSNYGSVPKLVQGYVFGGTFSS